MESANGAGLTARHGKGASMIDMFSLVASHGLILIAFWRLISRPDLDSERRRRSVDRTPDA
jgi:hypothetical protein